MPSVKECLFLLLQALAKHNFRPYENLTAEEVERLLPDEINAEDLGVALFLNRHNS